MCRFSAVRRVTLCPILPPFPSYPLHPSGREHENLDGTIWYFITIPLVYHLVFIVFSFACPTVTVFQTLKLASKILITQFQRVGSSPYHQTLLWHQLDDYNSAQFWNYLPGDSIRFYKLKAQSHKTALPLQMPSTNLGFYLCFGLIGNESEVPRAPPWVWLIC